ncbi:phytanoyl-CoA dioxygenase family protein [Paraburkholderia guartelaensis]|uniref:Phytanoyl-CoA dioxygenase family protein n=1 Tax=Paraburkholderia guartelaensis TaxID=2546446 RepID=A0A4R5L4S7_9BURK|nr:phytanoyl-CoA dioxygenase family protein [Paraburkholderia guartelaensis]TDG03516.1 phytanoyl-CoA dioxygenase family protein [Paraburkholderia guartelaensis]
MSQNYLKSKEAQISELHEHGFVVSKGFVDESCLQALRIVSLRELVDARCPLELEADLRYPGAPDSRGAPGGGTVRRLIDAYARDPHYANLATSPRIREWMEAYFGETPYLSRAHHNCVMTKHPSYGSLTGWHRDARYWSFERDDLVSVWVALGKETAENGALWFVPGSHRLALAPERFDDAKFFRSDLPENDAAIRKAVSPELGPGDVVFFHCNTLHSAGRNHSDQVKLSLVYTYRGESNAALVGTRSASKPEMALGRALCENAG